MKTGRQHAFLTSSDNPGAKQAAGQYAWYSAVDRADDPRIPLDAKTESWCFHDTGSRVA